MVDRRFSETDLRTMLETASGFHRDVAPGRWVIETRHTRRDREVIVEPDSEFELLVVITAYAVEE